MGPRRRRLRVRGGSEASGSRSIGGDSKSSPTKSWIVRRVGEVDDCGGALGEGSSSLRVVVWGSESRSKSSPRENVGGAKSAIFLV